MPGRFSEAPGTPRSPRAARHRRGDDPGHRLALSHHPAPEGGGSSPARRDPRPLLEGRIVEGPPMDCAFCEKPLICDACQAEYVPASPEGYRALSEGEEAILCPACAQVLVCHWCKTAYDGLTQDEADAAEE